MRDHDCAHWFRSSFCAGVTALVAAGLLAADVAAPPAAAAPRDPRLEELWEQFPLDAERDPPTARERSSGGAGAKAGPAPRVRSAADPQAGGAGATVPTWARVAIVAVGIALILGGLVGFVALVGGRAPRRPPARAPARPFLRPRQIGRAAAVATTAVPSADLPLTARGVRDGPRLPVSAAPPRRKPAVTQMLRTSDRAGDASQVDAMKAQPQAAHEPKHSTAGPEAEAEILKRKPPADATDTLKAKGQGEGMVDKERLAAGDAVALKEKLAAPIEQKQPPKPREHPRRVRVQTPDPEGRSAPRPVPDAAFVEAPTEAPDARTSGESMEECEVRWWRGYVKSQFTAVVTKADGAEATVASSPYFHWHKSALPQESPAAAAALRALVETLERDGWTVAGRGEEWFAVRFRTESSAGRAEPAAVHESGMRSGGGTRWQ